MCAEPLLEGLHGKKAISTDNVRADFFFQGFYLPLTLGALGLYPTEV